MLKLIAAFPTATFLMLSLAAFAATSGNSTMGIGPAPDNRVPFGKDQPEPKESVSVWHVTWNKDAFENHSSIAVSVQSSSGEKSHILIECSADGPLSLMLFMDGIRAYPRHLLKTKHYLVLLKFDEVGVVSAQGDVLVADLMEIQLNKHGAGIFTRTRRLGLRIKDVSDRDTFFNLPRMDTATLRAFNDICRVS